MARISKERKQEFHEEILRVAQEKFRAFGFDGVSTKDIAKDVGIAEGTLFNYFDSKMELFLEVFSTEFALEHSDLGEADLSHDIVDILYGHLRKTTKLVLKLPRPLLVELMISSIKMAKKRPKQFARFVEVDLRYMREIQVLLDRMIEAGLLQEMDTAQFSELIYSAVAYEFLMYLYDGNKDLDTMLQGVKDKLRVLVNGYRTGGQHAN